MKKFFILSAILFGLIVHVPLAHATQHSDAGTFKKIMIVEGRGLLNAISIPWELVASMRFEMRQHPRAWPVTYLPRLLLNFAGRFNSALLDMAFMPFVVPSTDDITPFTEQMGLPDYAWQTIEEEF